MITNLFFRIVYTGEQPEEEEAQLLDLLLRPVQLTISNDWEKNKVLKNNMSSSQDLEYKAVDSTQMNDGSGGFFLQSEVEMLRNGNRTDDDNVSASDTVTWSGTLADLTDPFSISSSDLMNISTLNANDDHMDATSVTSIEDLNEMEMFDTLVPAPAEVTKQPLVSCFDENREQKVVGLKEFDDNDDKLNLAASFRSSNEVKDFDFIDMKLDGLHVENDSTKIVNETTESRPKLVRKNTFELNAEELMEVVREPDTTFVIDTSGRSDSKRVCSLPIMVLSHESKDGDSGVGSVSRKLSTPSSVGHHSIGSDNVPNSPTGSIPKDDSLEFCPDSLASEEANVVRVSPSGPGSVDYSLKGPHLKLEHSEAVLGDFIASKEVSTDLHLPTCDASLGSKKLAWSGVEDLYEEISKEAQFELYTEKHRWAATNGSDSQYKSAAAAQQPSAADLTFNVDDNVHCDVGTKDSVANLSGETTTNQMHSKPARVNCSIKLDFVPFLKEKRTMINSDSIGDTKSYTHPLVNTPTIAPAATGDVNNANAVGQPSLDAKISFPLIDELLPQRVQNAKKTTPESDILSETHIEETSAQVITYLSKTDEVGPVSDALDDVSEEPQKSELQSPQLGRKENFYMFIDVSDVQSKAKENCEEISEICQKEMPKEKAAVGASDELDIHPKAQSAAVESDSLIGTEDAAIPAKPQPVYMFIEASSPHAPSNGSSFQEQHPKVSDKKTSFLRRRIPFTGSPKPHCRRPKSESAATLFEDKEVAADGDKIVKRLSLTFGTEHGECQPLEKAASDKDIPKGAQPFKKEPPFRLGEDLLKMFLNEVNTDVTVRIDGKDIKAHK